MLAELKKLLSDNAITSLYQPIFDRYTGEIFAYEALSRGPSDSPLHSPNQLFEYARQFGLLNELEALCREKAITGFIEKKLPGKLFINITPDSLEQPNHQKGTTLKLLERFNLSTSQVVIELTEQFPCTDETLLLKALKHYQKMGLAIALDDLGAGYSSLRLWSQAKPEFVKIDRHFIQNIDLDITKQEFVRSFTEIAKSMQCKVIAEGVETEAEYQYLRKLSVDYFQGYYFCRPQANPPTQSRVIDDFHKNEKAGGNKVIATKTVTAKNLAVHKVKVNTTQSVEQIAEIFQDKPNINSIAVVDDEKILGLISRRNVQGKLSKAFGRDLFSTRAASEVVMEPMPLVVDACLSIEQVSRLVTSRARYQQEDDFVICQDGCFVGIGHVIDLLRQVTEQQVTQARHANPLTQLPGLVPVNDCIDQLITSNNQFCVVHFDIDSFKPFNDVYGFAKGDQIILALGMSLQKFCNIEKDTIGHIGGDDFIAIYNSDDWLQRINDAIINFDNTVKALYLPEHVVAGGFTSKDRYEVERFHDIASVSIACVDISASCNVSHFEISSRLSPLKHAAKSYKGNSLILNDVDNYVPLGKDSALERFSHHG
jgi:EAL domain-containing protein (putative c-di-GMP-specific phosphodiesterase class I)/GGDEF domain-containing protein